MRVGKENYKVRVMMWELVITETVIVKYKIYERERRIIKSKLR